MSEEKVCDLPGCPGYGTAHPPFLTSAEIQDELVRDATRAAALQRALDRLQAIVDDPDLLPSDRQDAVRAHRSLSANRESLSRVILIKQGLLEAALKEEADAAHA